MDGNPSLNLASFVTTYMSVIIHLSDMITVYDVIGIVQGR